MKKVRISRGGKFLIITNDREKEARRAAGVLTTGPHWEGEGRCSLSGRKTTSQIDRAVGTPSPGLPTSLMSRHTRNMVFVPHSEEWRRLH